MNLLLKHIVYQQKFIRYCLNFFKQFKSGDFGFYSEKQACVLKIHEDGEQSGTSKINNDKEIANMLNVVQPRIMSANKKNF